MKYLWLIFSALCFVGIFLRRPWPEALAILAFSALLFVYSYVFGKLLVPKIKDQKLSGWEPFVFCFVGTLFVGGAFVSGIWPWLEQCVDQKLLISPLPLVSFSIILLTVPAHFYALRLVTLKNKKQSNQSTHSITGSAGSE